MTRYSPFLTLPRELREEVYSWVLKSPNEGRLYFDRKIQNPILEEYRSHLSVYEDNFTPLPIDLMLACKQVAEETRFLPLKLNSICFIMNDSIFDVTDNLKTFRRLLANKEAASKVSADLCNLVLYSFITFEEGEMCFGEEEVPLADTLLAVDVFKRPSMKIDIEIELGVDYTQEELVRLPAIAAVANKYLVEFSDGIMKLRQKVIDAKSEVKQSF